MIQTGSRSPSPSQNDSAGGKEALSQDELRRVREEVVAKRAGRLAAMAPAGAAGAESLPLLKPLPTTPPWRAHLTSVDESLQSMGVHHPPSPDIPLPTPPSSRPPSLGARERRRSVPMVLENQGSPRQCAGMMLVVAQHAAETDLERPEYQKQEESEAAESTEKEVIAAPSEQAEPSAAVSWHDAVLLTLTLDVDFNLIGDHEAFKQDVIKDVATAANVHAKYMKIAALRAGSVIVDMLIASEAGEPTKIVQGLLEQLKTPDSLLLRGKFTSKTKSLNPASLTATTPSAPLASGVAVSKTQMELSTDAQAPALHDLPGAARGKQLLSAPAAAKAAFTATATGSTPAYAASVQRPSLAAAEVHVTATGEDSPASVHSAAASRAELEEMPSFEEKLQQGHTAPSADASVAHRIQAVKGHSLQDGHIHGAHLLAPSTSINANATQPAQKKHDNSRSNAKELTSETLKPLSKTLTLHLDNFRARSAQFQSNLTQGTQTPGQVPQTHGHVTQTRGTLGSMNPMSHPVYNSGVLAAQVGGVDPRMYSSPSGVDPRMYNSGGVAPQVPNSGRPCNIFQAPAQAPSYPTDAQASSISHAWPTPVQVCRAT